MTSVIGESSIDVMDRACVDEGPWTATALHSSAETLSGHDKALGSRGGAGKVGPLGVDTELVTCHPRADEVARL